MVRPGGGEQAPGAGDDLRHGPDDDEKLASVYLHLARPRVAAIVRPSLRTAQIASARSAIFSAGVMQAIASQANRVVMSHVSLDQPPR